MRRLFVIAALTALVLAPGGRAGGPAMTIGVVDDQFKQPTLPLAKAKVDLARLAGMDSIRMTVLWERGRVEPEDVELSRLTNAVSAANLAGMRVYLSVAWGSRNTPLTADYRDQYAQFIQTLANDLPTVRHFTVGNEPNLNRFWLPQFGPDGEDVAAQGYELVLAAAYDALKGVSPKIVVIGGAVSPRGGDDPFAPRLTHSPTTFIPDLGAAYRASGRTKPIMDMFAFHPYQDTSSVPPTTRHPNSTTVSIADYDKLVALLGKAFDGTAQVGSTIPVLYNEFGVEAQVPPEKAALYTGMEPTTTKPSPEATQAAFYRQAIQIAFCQPTVQGIFVFQLIDDPALLGWQSGVYYADGTPKTSRAPVAAAASASRRGVVTRCAGLQLPVKGSLVVVPALGRRARVQIRCNLDCSFSARLERLPSRATDRVVRGAAVGGRPQLVTFPPARLAPGRYRFTASVRAAVNPGPTAVLGSRVFQIR